MDTGELPLQDSLFGSDLAAEILVPSDGGTPADRAVAPGVPDPTGEREGQQLVRVLETMPAAFCFFAPDWRFRYVNVRAEELLGQRRTGLLGRSLWTALPRTVGSRYETHFRSAMCSGEAVVFEAEHPERGTGWFEVRAWPGPEGLAVYLLDVTARRQAEERARSAAARTALLSSVTAELSGALDGESALGRLARLVVPTLADGCIVTVVDRDGRARDVGSWHADPLRRRLLEQYTEVRLDTLPAESPVARALEAGTPLTESVSAVLGMMRPGPARDLLGALGPESAVVLPLPAESRTVGVLTLYQDAGRMLSAEDMETARQVAAQAGRAVERVHRHSEQAKLAEGLQRSLLTDPPDIEDAEIVVRYVPAAEAARVGGDWYDAFWQRDGAPLVVIGDVVGHDTAAAAAMGQLRGLLRGIAHHSGAGPAQVLHGLDEAIAQMHTDTMATAAIARLERDPAEPGGWRRLRWANAGHPPLIVVAPDGEVSVLGGLTGDLMLGVDPTAQRQESVTRLVPGATVLLYTDGLVERRTSTFDVGMGRLTAQLRDLAGRPLEELCDALLERMLHRTPPDDVALVAVRLSEGGRAP
jgi:PAS domain S-box-containing protein